MADQGVGAEAPAFPGAQIGSLLRRVRRAAGRLLTLSAFLLGARLLGAAAGFLVQLLLARNLSPEHLGVYFAVTSLTLVAGVIAAHGHPSIATRFVSRYRAPKRAALLGAFARHAQIETTILALALAAGVAAAALLWPGDSDATRTALAIAAVTIPFVAAFRLYGAFATATRSFKLAYLPDVCLKPIIMLVLLGALVAIQREVSLIEALLVLAGATIVLSLAQFRLLARHFPVTLRLWRPKPAPKPARLRRLVSRWRREAHTVLLVAVVSQFFPELSILIATPVLDAAALGIFGVCLKLAFLVGFFVLLTQNMATPDLADALGRRGDRRAVARLAASGLAATALTLAATLFCVAWGGEALKLFGPGFAAGQPALVLLVAAQMVRASFGPTHAVLTIVGERRANLIVAALAVAVLAVSAVSLGTLFGLTGAAFAVLLSMLFWSAAGAWWLHRSTGLRVDLLGAWTS